MRGLIFVAPLAVGNPFQALCPANLGHPVIAGAGDTAERRPRVIRRCWLWGPSGTLTPPFPRARQAPSREDSPRPWMPCCTL
jgi:hypothetical protein